MARGYQVNEMREKIIDLLYESKTGLSGTEVSEQLGINRLTITKYLNIFAAEGSITQKNIGNITLWLTEEGIEKYRFPDDYYKIQKKFFDLLNTGTQNQINSLIQNCIHSGAVAKKMVSEVLYPSIKSVQKQYDDGKIGNSERKYLYNIISYCIQSLRQSTIENDPKKNALILSADANSSLFAEAASVSYRYEKWTVSYLGDMSSSIDVIFDLDLQKFLGRIWKQKNGIMVIVVFSESEEGLNFFSESIISLKTKIGKNLKLILCGKVGKKTRIKADLITEDIDVALQWSQTIFESKN